MKNYKMNSMNMKTEENNYTLQDFWDDVTTEELMNALPHELKSIVEKYKMRRYWRELRTEKNIQEREVYGNSHGRQ